MRRSNGNKRREVLPTMSTIDADQAKSRFDELLDQVARGEEVIITRDDRPVAWLSPIPGKRQRPFGSVQGTIWMSDDFDEPLDDFHEYM